MKIENWLSKNIELNIVKFNSSSSSVCSGSIPYSINKINENLEAAD
jgi:hypothetical protein